MSSTDQQLNQEILLRIMLQAYQMGVQKEDIDSRMVIDRLAYELKPYFQQEIGRVETGKRNRKEAAG